MDPCSAGVAARVGQAAPQLASRRAASRKAGHRRCARARYAIGAGRGRSCTVRSRWPLHTSFVPALAQECPSRAGTSTALRRRLQPACGARRRPRPPAGRDRPDPGAGQPLCRRGGAVPGAGRRAEIGNGVGNGVIGVRKGVGPAIRASTLDGHWTAAVMRVRPHSRIPNRARSQGPDRFRKSPTHGAAPETSAEAAACANGTRRRPPVRPRRQLTQTANILYNRGLFALRPTGQQRRFASVMRDAYLAADPSVGQGAIKVARVRRFRQVPREGMSRRTARTWATLI